VLETAPVVLGGTVPPCHLIGGRFASLTTQTHCNRIKSDSMLVQYVNKFAFGEIWSIGRALARPH
jgi:hypothetical protein